MNEWERDGKLLGGHPPRLADDHKNEYKIETSI